MPVVLFIVHFIMNKPDRYWTLLAAAAASPQYFPTTKAEEIQLLSTSVFSLCYLSFATFSFNHIVSLFLQVFLNDLFPENIFFFSKKQLGARGKLKRICLEFDQN